MTRWDRVAWETVRLLEDVRGLRAGFPVTSGCKGNTFWGCSRGPRFVIRGGWQPVVRSRGATHRRPAPTNQEHG
jgi:hypothetical protein